MSADEKAPRFAAVLTGRKREALAVMGHLSIALVQPPRVRGTADDVFLPAVASDQLLDGVQALLFGVMPATLVVDMRTCPTSGMLSTATALSDLEPA